MVRAKRQQAADRPRLSPQFELSANVVGSGQAVARVSDVLQRAGYHCQAGHDCEMLRESDVVVACCVGNDALLGRITSIRQSGDARPIIIIGHKKPCALCDCALTKGADLWIPETPIALLELQLPRSAWLLARRLSRLHAHTELSPNNEVSIAGRGVSLRPKESQLLKYLVSRAGQWTTERELLERVLGYGPRHDATVVRVHLLLAPQSHGRLRRMHRNKARFGISIQRVIRQDS